MVIKQKLCTIETDGVFIMMHKIIVPQLETMGKSYAFQFKLNYRRCITVINTYTVRELFNKEIKHINLKAFKC